MIFISQSNSLKYVSFLPSFFVSIYPSIIHASWKNKYKVTWIFRLKLANIAENSKIKNSFYTVKDNPDITLLSHHTSLRVVKFRLQVWTSKNNVLVDFAHKILF